MDCTRNRSKIWNRKALVWALLLILCGWQDALAAFATKFSLNVGEEFNDNIFFAKKKESDFVTIITPSLTFLYAPAGQTVPTLNVNLGTSGQVFANNGELSNFGNNMAINAGYFFQYSPRLTFRLSDTLQRQGNTRNLGLGNDSFSFQSPNTLSTPGADQSSASDQLRDFVQQGSTLINNFNIDANFLYRPDLSILAGYSNDIIHFIDRGGNDLNNQFRIRGVYNWRRDHNLHAGYSISILKSRDGTSSVAHNFDLGDDYFTNYQFKLTPTLSLSASTGISLATGGDGLRVVNSTNVTVTKLWEMAQFSAGVNKGLTPSFGVSGLSDTTSLFTQFNIRLGERLVANTGVTYSIFDADRSKFKTFLASLGAQYEISSWLGSSLRYSHRWRNGGHGLRPEDLIERGNVRSNSVFLSLTTNFDIWPNPGLARAVATTPITLKTPFPTPAAAMPSTGPSSPTSVPKP